jgi:SAM-dependent methyltransferase
MASRKTKPIAQAAYDELADAYAALIDTKPHNAYYERPATLSLLPEVNGKRVLDAGCGPGIYADWLLEHGAIVVALDANAKMVRLARKRLGERAQVVQANLETPLDFLESASFDIVLCPLVMDYIKNWEATFSEFWRVLCSGGILIFSLEHPYAKFDSHRDTSNYHQVELVKYTWRGFGIPVDMPSYRCPVGEVINPLLRAGFILEQILEPLPTPEFKQYAPDDYDQLMREPGFMVVKARKG